MNTCHGWSGWDVDGWVVGWTDTDQDKDRLTVGSPETSGGTETAQLI